MFTYVIIITNWPIESCKDLGRTFQTNCKFYLKYRHTVSRAFKALGFLIRNTKHFRRTNILVSRYNSFVTPHLEYASVIWSLSTACISCLIWQVQRKFLSFLYYKRDHIFPSYPLLISYRTLLSNFNFQYLKSHGYISICYSVTILWNN